MLALRAMRPNFREFAGIRCPNSGKFINPKVQIKFDQTIFDRAFKGIKCYSTSGNNKRNTFSHSEISESSSLQFLGIVGGLSDVLISSAHPGPTLDDIRNANGNINQIRLLLKGNLTLCLTLFRKALKEDDVISQIHLSRAYYGMVWGKDNERYCFYIDEFEDYYYYPRLFLIYSNVHEMATGEKLDWRESDARDLKIFKRAAELGDLSAILEVKHAEWFRHTESYGFASELYPYIDKGDKMVEFYFGRALKNSCQVGSKRYYEGLYWMEKSGQNQVLFPKENKDFESFKSHYVRYEDVHHTYFDYDGFCHVGPSVILAPSKEAWEKFKLEKLSDVEIAPLESYVFTFDIEKIRSQMKDFKVTFSHSGSFVKHETEGKEYTFWDNEKAHGFRIDSLSVYKDNDSLGKISVRMDTNTIHESINHPEIAELISAMEEIMKASSAGSAYSWLRKISD